MAITGTGTQADPYVVTTWDELVTAVYNYQSYVKLGADIDMNDEHPEGITTACELRCEELDGDGHMIKNLSAVNLVYIFVINYSGVTIKNCDFFNFRIEANSSSPGVGYFAYGENKSINFYMCKFSGRMAGVGYPVYINRGTASFKRCSLNLETEGLFSVIPFGNNAIIFEYTNVKFTGAFSGYLYLTLKNAYLSGSLTDGTSLWLEAGCVDSVIDMECPAVSGYSSEHCLANSDKVSSISSATPVTTAQLTNAAYLASIGFPIQT